MRRINLENHNTLKELKDAAKKTKEIEERIRINAIVKVKEGKTGPQIVEMLLISRKSLGNWIKKYNHQGLKGLETKRSGREEGNPKWSKKIFKKLTKKIDNTEQYWSVPIMSEWIKENYQEDIPHSTILYHLNKLGYSYTSSRPYPYKGDEEKQEEFKKKALERWSKSAL